MNIVPAILASILVLPLVAATPSNAQFTLGFGVPYENVDGWDQERREREGARQREDDSDRVYEPRQHYHRHHHEHRDWMHGG